MRYQTADELIADLDKVPETVAAPPKAAAASNNIWKTAFIVLVGTMALAAALIYATSSRQTNPTTALQSDANSFPVQPINPATGTDEQALANTAFLSGTAQYMGNSNGSFPAMDPVPGGDGYNPWAGGGTMPGAPPPSSMPPGGGVVTIDPNGLSPFVQDDNVILVPVQVDANGRPVVPGTVKTPPSNVNSRPAPDNSAPKVTSSPKPSKTSDPKPVTTPTPPLRKTPEGGDKKLRSGKNEDS